MSKATSNEGASDVSAAGVSAHSVGVPAVTAADAPPPNSSDEPLAVPSRTRSMRGQANTCLTSSKVSARGHAANEWMLPRNTFHSLPEPLSAWPESLDVAVCPPRNNVVE